MYEVKLLPDAEEWLLSLPKAEKKEMIILIKMLEKLGFELQLPHSRKLKGTKEKVKELRCTRFGNRLYYVHFQKEIYVGLLGGNKGTQKLNIVKADKQAKKVRTGVLDYEKY